MSDCAIEWIVNCASRVWSNICASKVWSNTFNFRIHPGKKRMLFLKFVYLTVLICMQAAYIINGNCKNIMNMSQSDQLELWHCVVKGMLVV